MNFLIKTALLVFMGMACSIQAMMVIDNEDIAALFIATSEDSAEKIYTIAQKNSLIVHVRSSLCAKTALHLAVDWNHKKAAQALINCGADKTALDQFFNTPFSYIKDDEMRNILLTCNVGSSK